MSTTGKMASGQLSSRSRGLRRYDLRKENNLCVRCGHGEPKEGYVTCNNCVDYFRRRL